MGQTKAKTAKKQQSTTAKRRTKKQPEQKEIVSEEGKALVITEKPSVARDIVAAIGGKKAFKEKDGYYESDRYIVTWAVGHLLELLAPEDIDTTYRRWRLSDLPIFPETFALKPKAGQKGRLELLKKLFRRKDVTRVVNACDAGREGELIFREICRYVGNTKPVQRLWLQSMTPEAIREGFENLRPGEEFEGLGTAAECRAESDWLIGMNATRAITKRLQTRRERTPWSVGRVQTPTLALVVDRELEILSHQSKPYWRIRALFEAPDHKYEGWWFKPGERTKGTEESEEEDRSDWILNEEEARKIVQAVEGKEGVASEERKTSKERAPLPFDLTSLQREAHRRYGYSARRTLEAAQRLYEEYKLITYPRTDSRYLPGDYLPKVNKVISLLAGSDAFSRPARRLLEEGLQNRGRVFNDAGVTDHFALMPTEQLPGKLPQAEGRIYDLVVRQFLAAFFPPAVWETVTRITIVGKEHFRTRARVLREPGWRFVFEQEGRRMEKILPLARPRVPVAVLEVEVVQEETKPPPRITEAGLLNLMENAGKQIEDEELSAILKDKGLGTPATRAEIIENLISRSYMKRVGKALAATPKGIRLIDILRRIKAQRLASPELTGELEYHLRQIERGERSREDFSAEIREYTQEVVDRAKTFDFEKLYAKDPPVGPCPLCKRRRVVEESLLYRCTGVPSKKCTFVLWKEKQGRYLDRKTVETLLKEGRTPPLYGFFSRENKPFRAVLYLDKNGQLQLEPVREGEEEAPEAPVDPRPIAPCPICKEGQVIETPRSYICSRGAESGCHFALPRKVAGRTLSREEVAEYVKKGRTPVLEGFVSRRGRRFSAALVLGENGRHRWEFPSRGTSGGSQPLQDVGPVVDPEPLGTCPVCKKGNVITAEKAYVCSRALEEESSCSFKLPRELAGRSISRSEAIDFVTKGKTEVLEGFVSRRGRPFKAALALTKNGKLRWVFPSRTRS